MQGTTQGRPVITTAASPTCLPIYTIAALAATRPHSRTGDLSKDPLLSLTAVRTMRACGRALAICAARGSPGHAAGLLTCLPYTAPSYRTVHPKAGKYPAKRAGRVKCYGICDELRQSQRRRNRLTLLSTIYVPLPPSGCFMAYSLSWAKN